MEPNITPEEIRSKLRLLKQHMKPRRPRGDGGIKPAGDVLSCPGSTGIRPLSSASTATSLSSVGPGRPLPGPPLYAHLAEQLGSVPHYGGSTNSRHLAPAPQVGPRRTGQMPVHVAQGYPQRRVPSNNLSDPQDNTRSTSSRPESHLPHNDAVPHAAPGITKPISFPDRPLSGQLGSAHQTDNAGVGARRAVPGAPSGFSSGKTDARQVGHLRVKTAPTNQFHGGNHIAPGDGSDGPSPPGSPVPSPSPAQTSSPSGSTRGRRDEGDRGGVRYLTVEELPPLAASVPDRFLNDVIRRLGNADDWSEQFNAIDDARRLTRFAGNALIQSSQLRKILSLILGLVESLRSALAKNALRCTGEMFATFGKRLDADIDCALAAILRRAGDTNSFIAEEADHCLQEVCRSGSEVKLLPAVLAAASTRNPRAREKGVWCMAMVGQRLVNRSSCAVIGPSIRNVADAIAKALGDASADVRQAARVGVLALLSGGTHVDDFIIPSRFAGAMIPGVSLEGFDAFDVDCVQRCAELARAAGLFSSSTAHHRGVRSVGGTLR